MGFREWFWKPIDRRLRLVEQVLIAVLQQGIIMANSFVALEAAVAALEAENVEVKRVLQELVDAVQNPASDQPTIDALTARAAALLADQTAAEDAADLVV